MNIPLSKVKRVMSIHMQLKGYFHKENATSNVGYLELRALMALDANTEMDMKELSQTLQISPSSCTQLMNRLRMHGYIERKESSKDRRLVVVTLSAKGLKEMQKKWELMQKKVKRLFSTFTSEELDVYIKLHQKLLDHKHYIDSLDQKKESI